MACLMHYAKDKWELYHIAEDFGQATDLARQGACKAQGVAGSLPSRSDQIRSERWAARHTGRTEVT
jgi:hypothetical protein